MLCRTLQQIVFISLFSVTGLAADAIVLLEKSGWNVQMNGLAELDVIFDTNRSVSDLPGNSPIDLESTANGSHPRTQFSVRNSRFGFIVKAPEVCDFTTKAVLEMDFLGHTPGPGTGNTEAGFFNNPAIRLRHAYMQANYGGFQLVVGQTWQLFAWQPYYFMSSEQIFPIASMVFGRTGQIKAMHTFSFGDNFATLQLALAALRPVQRDAVSPDFQGGVRLAFNQRTSAFTGGSSSPIKHHPASLGVSGLIRNIAVPGATVTATSNNFVAAAVAGHVFVPVLKCLSLASEFTYGSGYGDQFTGFTGNLPNPFPIPNMNLDPGIGGFDAANNFKLANLYTFNVHAQYHLPDWMRTYFNLGMGQLYSDNMADFVTPRPAYKRSMVIFANVVHNFSEQIRAGFEYAYMQTGYTDGGIGFNNRYQLTTQFIF